jgi:hypothetical protein
LSARNLRVLLHRAGAGAGADRARALLRGDDVTVDEIVCRQFVELATDYVERAMPDATLELVEEHLAMCDWCRDYLDQIETTARAVGAEADGGETAPPAETLQPLLSAFRARTGGSGGS